MISAFGCMNSLILTGARAYYAMALDGVFFKKACTLNRANVPSSALVMQGIWSAVLVLIRTYQPATGTYGNLYSNLLDYVISAALIFYILTIAGVISLAQAAAECGAPIPQPLVIRSFLRFILSVRVSFWDSVHLPPGNHDSRGLDCSDWRSRVLLVSIANAAGSKRRRKSRRVCENPILPFTG